MKPLDAVVVGGGLTGLTLAHRLNQSGRSVVLLEAQAQAGGNIRTSHEQGFLFEEGPNAYLDREPAMGLLLKELRLEASIVDAAPEAKRRFIVRGGKPRALPTSPLGLFTSDFVPFTAKLRLAAEPFLARRGDGSDESLARFSSRHFGDAVTRLLVDAVQTGIHAGDVDRLSVAAAFPMLVEMESKHRSLVLGMMRSGRRQDGTTGKLRTLRHGMASLPQALAQQLGNHLRLNTKVLGLSKVRDLWSVQTETGEPLQAKRLVLAIPAFAAGALLRPLDEALAKSLDEIAYSPVAVVSLGFRKADLTRIPEGFGLLAPSQEKQDLLGVIFSSSAFPFRAPTDAALLTCMLGGARQPHLPALDDNTLLSLCAQTLDVLLGIQAIPLVRKVTRWPKGIPQYNVGGLDRLAKIRAAAERLPGLILTGNAYEGIGLNDCVRIANHAATCIEEAAR